MATPATLPPTEEGVLPLSLAPQIAGYHLSGGPSSEKIELSQARHRIRLVNTWGPGAIGPGSRVLEIGCGQGTCTAVLAEAVGPAGRVDAVDPAPADYGAPVTLGQAQAHLSGSPAVGGRIAWHRADPVEFLEKEEEGNSSTSSSSSRPYDVTVLAHCIWYFRSGDVLPRMLAALRARGVRRVLVAEWALRASAPAAAPHVLATVARATLEAHRVDSCQNIQTPLAPRAVREAALAAGWTVASETILVPEPDVSDGFWETSTVADEKFAATVEASVEHQRVKDVLRSARDAVLAAVDAVDGGLKKVQSMDVWVATLSC